MTMNDPLNGRQADPCSLEFPGAVQALEHIYTDSKPLSDLTAIEVLEGVCRYYNVDPALVRGKQRDREIVWPRQVGCQT